MRKAVAVLDEVQIDPKEIDPKVITVGVA